MKKIIPFFLLAVSASSSFFLAQAQNRLEVRGDRLEKTENQSKDYRLEDRLEEIESQIKDNRKYALRLENQICLGADVTTNYELQTTNCNNQGDDLDCYMTMDPAELKPLEEGVENLRGVFGLSGESATSSQVVVNPAASLHSSVESGCKYSVNPSVEYAKGSTDNQSDSSNLNQPIAYSLQPTASIRSVDRIVMSSSSSVAMAENRKRAYEESAANMGDTENALLGQKKDNFNFEEKILAITSQIEEALEKSEKVDLIQSKRLLWKELAKDYQVAADYYQNALKANNLGKINDSTSWGRAGYSAHSSVDYYVKAIEAQDAGKTTLAEGYKEAAVTSQRAADQWSQSLVVTEDSKIISCRYKGKYLQDQAGYQVKASEAQGIGKITLAAGYREAASNLEKAANQWEKAAQAFALKKPDQAISYQEAGKSLQAMADYQVKLSEAKEAGNTILAATYRDHVATSERDAHRWEQAALAVDVRKDSDAISSEEADKTLQAIAAYQAKAYEAQEIGKEQLAAGYREAAAILDVAVGYYRQAALSYANMRKGSLLSGEKQGYSWNSAAQSLESQANYWVKASEAEEEGRTVLAVAYREAATISQEAADYGQKAAENFAIKDNGGGGWYWKGKSLQVVADYQVKAAEAQEAEKIQLAAAYREVAEISERASNYWELAASSFDAGREDEAISWQNQATSLQAEADYQVNRAIQIEAEEVVNS
ncbi:MAG TPA: hypothetical protein VJK54_01970 [Chthoniobacterales bacterium]|nr:hypothetical protein [Chthoniobacterales bacterium]